MSKARSSLDYGYKQPRVCNLYRYCLIASHYREHLRSTKGTPKEAEGSPFCPSRKMCYLGGQMGDKMGDNQQILKLKNKNLQKWA